jgi:hypothetical protein
MYQIDSVGSVTLLPAPTSPGTPGFWSAGNAGAGIRATRLDQDWFNMLQNTLVFVQRVAGLSDSKSDYTQLYTALLSCSRLTDTGAVNALAATPVDQPAWASLPPLSAIPDGFLVRVVPVATSTTTTPTFSFNGGAAVGITDALGAALLKGDIIAGVPAELMKAGGAAPTWWLLNPARRADQRQLLRHARHLFAAGAELGSTLRL